MYLKQTSICLLLFILFLFVGCSGANQPDKEMLVLDFFNLQSQFEEGDWIEIEEFKFVHYSNRPTELFNKNILPLPASVVKDSIGNREKLSKVGNANIATRLALNLKYLNEEIITDTEKEFVIHEPHLITIQSKLKITKKDSSKIQIRTSKDYPLKINRVPLNK